MKYIGIDLHATNSVVAIVDAQEQVLYCKRHANRLQHILALLRPYRDSGCVAAVESTYNWYWLIDGLKAEGFDVRLANSAALPQYPGLKYSDDETDAIKLARLLARGILPEGYIYPVEERGVRDLLRRRLVLVRTRAQQLTAIDGLLARHLGASMTSSLLKRLDASSLCALPLPKEAVLQALAHLRVREVLDCEVAALEEHLTDRLAKREDVRLLKTVPGIGSILAATIALEVGDTSAGSPMPGVSLPIAGWSRVRGFPMARSRVTATPNVATVIWPGRSWRRRCLPNAGHRRRKAFIANARPNATSSLH